MEQNNAHNATFYKTFTGADAIAFAIFPDVKPILLGSLTTISYSMYREKKPVPLLSRINTGGFTRGMRSIAGSMIFTLINQHFSSDLLQQIPYLAAHGKMKVDELPMFDIMIVCANEFGHTTEMMIYGVDFIEDGQVLSIQDMYIETTFGFVARDIDEFTYSNPVVNSTRNLSRANLNIDTVMPYDFTKSGYKESMNSVMSSIRNTELLEAQERLKVLGLLKEATGVYDNKTFDAVMEFQINNNLNGTGYLDIATFESITEEDGVAIIIKNKNGAFVYDGTDMNKVVGIAKYNENFISTEYNTEFYKISFFGLTGYIKKEDTNIGSSIAVKFDDFIESGIVHKVKIEDFNPSRIGSCVWVGKSTEIKISTVTHYVNKAINTNSRYYELKSGEERDFHLGFISDAFIYSATEESLPKFIEFIINPATDKYRKWIVELIYAGGE